MGQTASGGESRNFNRFDVDWKALGVACACIDPRIVFIRARPHFCNLIDASGGQHNPSRAGFLRRQMTPRFIYAYNAIPDLFTCPWLHPRRQSLGTLEE